MRRQLTVDCMNVDGGRWGLQKRNSTVVGGSISVTIIINNVEKRQKLFRKGKKRCIKMCKRGQDE